MDFKKYSREIIVTNMQKLTEILKKIFKEYKIMLYILGGVCVLGYGFTITHHSIGIDNNAYNLYYVQLGALSQGRLTQFLIDKITGAYTYPPFWANCLGVIILYFSAIAWCALFIRVGKEKVNQLSCIIFSTIFVSYPIINEHFIFLPLDFPLGYGLTALALFALHEAYLGKKYSLGILSVALMFLVISLNESFASVFLCGVIMIMIFKYIFDEVKEPNFNFFKFAAIASLVLISSIVVEYAILEIVKNLAKINAYVPASNMNIAWFKRPLMVIIKKLYFGLIDSYIRMGKYYFPITVFIIAGISSLVSGIIISIYKKKPFLPLFLILLYFSIISSTLIKGSILPYRTASTLAIFIAFTFMFMLIFMKKRWIKTGFLVLMIVLVLNQTKVLSGWFYNDYLRYERDKEIALDISHIIEKQMDETKPVVFIGRIERPANIRRIKSDLNGVSFITVYADKRESRVQFNYLLNDFFELHGHSFKFASDNQYEAAKKIAVNMPNYPDQGSIFETDEFIIVNFD